MRPADPAAARRFRAVAARLGDTQQKRSRKGIRMSFSPDRQGALRSSAQLDGEMPVAARRELAPYSRVRGGARYTQVAAGRKRKRTVALSVLVAIVAVVAIGVGIAAASAVGFYNSIGDRLNEGVTAETKAVLADQQASAQSLVSDWTDMSPFYMLLLGSDSSDSRRTGAEAELYGDDDTYFRTDTIILARVDPGNEQVTLVSIHRDTYYPVDGVWQKINNAYSLGGVAETIEVISDYAGVPISHYAEIDMSGLAAMVDALGGVEVDVPYEIDDEEYTGHLDAGLQTLNGEQALIFARSRHAYDDLGDGDRYRAAHQRLLISAIAKKLVSSSPIDMVNAIDTIANYIDTDFSLDQIVSLAMAMRGIDMDTSVYSTMNPTEPEVIDGTYYEITDEDAWEAIMEAVDAGEKPPSDAGYVSVTDDINNPDYGTAEASTDGAAAPPAAEGSAADPTSEVSVKDASGGTGAAEAALSTLTGAGWSAEDGGVANLELNDTVVVYGSRDQRANAEAIAELLGATVEAAGDTWSMTGDIMVVVGSN